MRIDLRGGEAQPVRELDVSTEPQGISVTPDGAWVLFAVADRRESDILMIDERGAGVPIERSRLLWIVSGLRRIILGS